MRKLLAQAFLPIELAIHGFEQLEEEFQEHVMGIHVYFEATYIGRRGPAERRRPLFQPEWWGAEQRMLTGSLRTNNAIESFHNAFACSVAQAGRPNVARLLESDTPNRI